MKKLFKTYFPVLFIAAASVLQSGCATTDNGNNALTAEQQMLLDKAAENKCIELLEAYKRNDYKRLQSALPPSLARQFTEEAFKQSRNAAKNTLGEIKSYEFLTRLQAPVFRNMIYKVKFQRTGSDRKIIEQEALFRVMLAENNGIIQVLSFVFF